jgi:signal transduction histidine kinase
VLTECYTQCINRVLTLILPIMNLSSFRRKQVIYLVLVGFVIMVFVQWALLSNAYKGKEKDFNDKFFYVVRFYEDQLIKDTSVMNRLTNINTAVDLAKTRVQKDLDSVFISNDIPTDFVYAVGKSRFEDGRMKMDSTLIWSSDPVYNSGLKATKLKIANLGPKGVDNYYIKVFLPSKPAYLLRSLLPLIVTLILTLLILFFCFLALASIIKKQASLAEIKNDFINNMTHELKTPLFTISIASKMLAEQALIKENSKYVSRKHSAGN